jgi:hypothetical protein
VDHADSSLAGSTEPLRDSVAGTDASPGENSAMNAHPTSTKMGEEGELPPSPAPHPQKQNLVVYTKVWTHLWSPKFLLHATFHVIPSFPALREILERSMIERFWCLRSCAWM